MISTFLPLLLAAAPQGAPRVDVVQSTIPGSASAQVPGFPGIELDNIFKVGISPSGRWISRGNSVGSTPSNFIVLDSGEVLANGAVAPWTGAATMLLTAGNTDVGVNDSGQYFVAVKVNDAGQQPTWLARGQAGVWTGIFDTRGPIPGAPGVFFNTFRDLNGLANGTVAFGTDVRGLPSDRHRFLLQPPMIDQQTGVKGPTDPVTGLEVGKWYGWTGEVNYLVNPSGSHRLSRGTLVASPGLSEELLCLNNEVMIREQVILSGSGFTDPVAAIFEMHLAPDGTWSAVGVNDPPGSASPYEYWAVRNGTVVAKEGDPILPGDARVWHDGTGVGHSMLFCVSNGSSHYLGGIARNTGTNARIETVVLEGNQVVLEKGDPIDLNGNGLFDDNIVFDGFAASRWATVDRTGRLWFLAIVRDTATNVIDQALLRISPNPVTLDVPPLIAGAAATLEVQDATPGKTAVILYSLVGPGPSSLATPFGVIATEVGLPFILTPGKVVPASGTAVFPVFVPGGLAGLPVWAQAAVYDPAGAVLSNAYAGAVN